MRYIAKKHALGATVSIGVKIALSFGHQTQHRFASVYLAWVPSDLVFNSTLRESIK